MNVAGMIRRAGRAYTVTRSNADGTYSPTDGSFVPGATATLTVVGSVQPAKLTPEELVSIPEGDRIRERFRFYSAIPLLNNRTSLLRKGDSVSINGVAFQVEKIAHWPNHSVSILVRANDAFN